MRELGEVSQHHSLLSTTGWSHSGVLPISSNKLLRWDVSH